MIKKILLIYSLIILYFFSVTLMEWLKKGNKYYIPENKKVDECCCPMNVLKSTNDNIFPILDKLSKTYFFKIFRVNLEKDCPFWVKKKICTSSSCVLCKCDETEIPKTWNKTDLIINDKSLEKYNGWSDKPNIFEEFIIEDIEDQSQGTYINLEKNPESYTGYQGRNIWPAIYNENCFDGTNGRELCHEEKMFNRIISGLHASINSHIFEYFMDSNSKDFSANVDVYFDRVGNYNERIENIYFTFSLLVRAINIASSFVHEYEINTGGLHNDEDKKTQQLLKELLEYTNKNCYHSFREDEFFNDIKKREIKFQIQKYIHNISQIMDCVECEKCRVHGTLQIHGIGAAFKILFSDDRKKELVYLKRNEFIALIITLVKFSKSIQILDLMHERKYFVLQSKLINIIFIYLLGIIALFLINKVIERRIKRKKSHEKTN